MDESKYKLIAAIKECMKETPVDKISVSEICKKANVTRQTFYRNFLDKYDLINWYFDKILLESFARMGSGKTIYEGLVKKFNYIKEEYLFFVAAFRSDDQNSLKEHDYQLILDFYQKLITSKTNEPIDENIVFYLEAYCKSSVYMTVKWVLEGMKKSSEELASLLVDCMPLPLIKIFEQYNILQEK